MHKWKITECTEKVQEGRHLELRQEEEGIEDLELGYPTMFGPQAKKHSQLIRDCDHPGLWYKHLSPTILLLLPAKYHTLFLLSTTFELLIMEIRTNLVHVSSIDMFHIQYFIFLVYDFINQSSISCFFQLLTLLSSYVFVSYHHLLTLMLLPSSNQNYLNS